MSIYFVLTTINVMLVLTMTNQFSMMTCEVPSQYHM